MSKKKYLNRNINSIKKNSEGLEYDIFKRFFLSEKSVELQHNGTVSFFVDDFVNKTLIRDSLNKICQEDNCIKVNVLNMKPRCSRSRFKRGLLIKKFKGKTVNSDQKKVYARLKNVNLFLQKLSLGGHNE